MSEDQVIDPSPAPPETNTVFGDLTYGDKVGRDKITASGKGIAIGAGAVAYNYEVQVNMPPELVRQLLAASTQGQQEDYGRAELSRESWEPETVPIPAGPFLMGSVSGEGILDWESPQFTMELPAYRIGKYPITNGQYARFVQVTGGDVPTELGWRNGNQPAPDQINLPVLGVTWYEALAYCVWLIEHTKRPYTLPSEAEWEKAARGPQGQLFPWGNEWSAGANCNVNCTAVKAVDAYPAGASPYGCFDMVGNGREWTTTLWGRQRRFPQDRRSPYPWQMPWKPNEGVDELNVNRQVRRVTRGGAALVADVPLRAARRSSELPYLRGLTNGRVGFRVALNWEA